MDLDEHCPTCRSNWGLNPPVKCYGSNHYRCIECKAVYSREMLAASDLLNALINVRKLISEAALTGFNCKDGDWAEHLFLGQQKTSAAIKKATKADSNAAP